MGFPDAEKVKLYATPRLPLGGAALVKLGAANVEPPQPTVFTAMVFVPNVTDPDVHAAPFNVTVCACAEPNAAIATNKKKNKFSELWKNMDI